MQPAMPTIRFPRRAKGQREPHWLVIAFVSALLTALITTDTVKNGVAAVKDLLDGTPSIEQQYVDQFVSEARDERRWTGPPTVFPEAIDYLKREFSSVDPRVDHKFSKRDGMFVPLESLIHDPEQAAGPVVTFGQVVSAAVTDTGHERSTIEIVFADPNIRNFNYKTVEGLVVCRASVPAPAALPSGRLVMFFSGVPLAKGPMRATWGGFVNAVYAICGSGTAAVNLCGRSSVPGFPNVDCDFAGQPLVPRPPARPKVSP